MACILKFMLILLILCNSANALDINSFLGKQWYGANFKNYERRGRVFDEVRYTYFSLDKAYDEVFVLTKINNIGSDIFPFLVGTFPEEGLDGQSMMANFSKYYALYIENLGVYIAFNPYLISYTYMAFYDKSTDCLKLKILDVNNNKWQLTSEAESYYIINEYSNQLVAYLMNGKSIRDVSTYSKISAYFNDEYLRELSSFHYFSKYNGGNLNLEERVKKYLAEAQNVAKNDPVQEKFQLFIEKLCGIWEIEVFLDGKTIKGDAWIFNSLRSLFVLSSYKHEDSYNFIFQDVVLDYYDGSYSLSSWNQTISLERDKDHEFSIKRLNSSILECPLKNEIDNELCFKTRRHRDFMKLVISQDCKEIRQYMYKNGEWFLHIIMRTKK